MPDSPDPETSALSPRTAEPSSQAAGEALAEAAALLARLRAPDGCPWDREQTFDTIKRHTLEETYEVFDAIERRAWPDLRDELGDLLLQVLFYAQMGAEAGYFDLTDVGHALSAKLRRRHPHIFGSAEAGTAAEVLTLWERVKAEEKKQAGPAAEARAAGLLDEIPRTMPAMLEAGKLGARAAKVGFDWPDVTGLLAKLTEETAELAAEVNDPAHPEHAERLEDEFGDLLFTAAQLGRHLKLDAESALRRSSAKFRRRFRAMEHEGGHHEGLAALSPEDLEALWTRAKVSARQDRRDLIDTP